MYYHLLPAEVKSWILPTLVFQWCPVTATVSIYGVQQVRCFLPEDGSRAGFRNVVFYCF